MLKEVKFIQNIGRFRDRQANLRRDSSAMHARVWRKQLGKSTLADILRSLTTQ